MREMKNENFEERRMTRSGRFFSFFNSRPKPNQQMQDKIDHFKQFEKKDKDGKEERENTPVFHNNVIHVDISQTNRRSQITLTNELRPEAKRHSSSTTTPIIPEIHVSERKDKFERLQQEEKGDTNGPETMKRHSGSTSEPIIPEIPVNERKAKYERLEKEKNLPTHENHGVDKKDCELNISVKDLRQSFDLQSDEIALLKEGLAKRQENLRDKKVKPKKLHLYYKKIKEERK